MTGALSRDVLFWILYTLLHNNDIYKSCSSRDALLSREGDDCSVSPRPSHNIDIYTGHPTNNIDIYTGLPTNNIDIYTRPPTNNTDIYTGLPTNNENM